MKILLSWSSGGDQVDRHPFDFRDLIPEQA